MLEKSEDRVSGPPVSRLSYGRVWVVSSALGALGVDLSLRVVRSCFFATIYYRGSLGVCACCILVLEIREVYRVNGAGSWDGGLGGCGIG